MDYTVTYTTQPVSSTIVQFCHKDDLPPNPSPSFKGNYLQTVLLLDEKKNTLLIGVGDLDKLTPLKLKELGAKASKTLRQEKIYQFDVNAGALTADEEYYRNVPQGILLGVYSFEMKSKKTTDEVSKWDISMIGKKENQTDAEHALNEGLILAESIMKARDLINTPANHLRPADYAQHIHDWLTPLDIDVAITSGDDLKEMGMNGLYSVGNSSDYPPQLVVMEYNNNPDGEKIALVGKGITYDTGGYSLKPSRSMITMEGDMAGSAAVAATIYALAKNKIKVNVVAIAVLAENRLSNRALLPGDIYTAYDGQTVQVLNTDAEGRLVLADAVAYAVKDQKADQVVDIATLTGAVVRSLGYGVAGTVTNSKDMWEKIESASQLSGERYWNFPTYREYHEMIKSDVADVQNIGKPEGGSITGGLFIGRFVNDKPWIHLDIAGTSWMDSPLFEHQTKGAQGAGVDTMYYVCKNAENK